MVEDFSSQSMFGCQENKIERLKKNDKRKENKKT